MFSAAVFLEDVQLPVHYVISGQHSGNESCTHTDAPELTAGSLLKLLPENACAQVTHYQLLMLSLAVAPSP